MPPPPRQLGSFAEVSATVDGLEAAPRTLPGPLSLGAVLAHCAQSIDYSLSGFPQLRSPLFRATAGRLALRLFLRRGWFNHDLSAAIPGGARIAPELPLRDGAARLRAALAAFQAHRGPLQPHFAYGTVGRADYEKVHAMHLADHLSALRPA